MYRTPLLLAALLLTPAAPLVAQFDRLECGGYHNMGYLGIFQGGTAKQAITGDAREAGMVWEDFVWFWNQKVDEGLHLTDFDSYPGHDGERRYTGVFEEGNGHVLIAEQTWSQFYSLKEQYEAEGLRLVDVETQGGGYGSSYRRYFHGVFHPTTDEVELHINLSWDGLVALREQKAREGMRLVDVETYVEVHSRLFLALFRSGSGGHGLWSSTWWDFKKTWNEWTAVGLHMIDVESYRQGDEMVYIGVYGPNPNGRVFIAGWDWDKFQEHRKGYNELGYVLTDMEVQHCTPPEPTFMEHGKERFFVTALERIVRKPRLAREIGIVSNVTRSERPTFLRGDANGDGVIQMSDALVILGALFRGVGDIDCEDAADANDDGSLDLSDAMGILNYLYGGNAPAGIASFEEDGTEDALGCTAQNVEAAVKPTPQVLEAHRPNVERHDDHRLQRIDPGEPGERREPVEPLKRLPRVRVLNR